MSLPPRRHRVLYALLALPALLVLLPAHRDRRDPSTPLPLTVWIWSTGPRIDPDAVRSVLACGAEAPFVKAGTFGCLADGLDYRPEMRQGDLPNTSCRLVYSFDPEVVRSLEKIGAEGLARGIAQAYSADVDTLRLPVRGLQVDLDCPTRLLPFYARMLHLLRAALPPGTELSTTTLLCWLDASSFPEVLREVDFHVPMAFGYRVPQRVDEEAPIADREHVLAATQAADRLGKPYWIGLGAYGYVLSFREDGTLEHVHGKSDVREVLGPCVRFGEAGRFVTLSPLLLHGIEVPAGRTLRADRVRVGTLAGWLAELRKEAGPRCRGAVLFRLAGKEDPLALSPAGFRVLARGGETFSPEVRVQGEGATLRVLLSNAGPDAGACGPRAHRVTLHLTQGRFLFAARGAFDEYESRLGGQRASVGRSDRLVFSADWLGGEEAIRSGLVTLSTPFDGELTAEIASPSGVVKLGPIPVRR